jgi:hypothetical protein
MVDVCFQKQLRKSAFRCMLFYCQWWDRLISIELQPREQRVYRTGMGRLQGQVEWCQKLLCRRKSPPLYMYILLSLSHADFEPD